MGCGMDDAGGMYARHNPKFVSKFLEGLEFSLLGNCVVWRF